MAMFSRKNVFYALYTLGAFVFFLWFLFPADFFADYLEAMIARQNRDLTVTIGQARPALPFALSLRDVACTVKAEDITVTADALKVKPGLISLIRGNPEIAFTMKGFGGKISGRIVIPERNPEKMSVENVTVSGLNLETLEDIVSARFPGFTIRGTLDARGSYSPEGRGNGVLSVSLTDLRVTPDKPFFTISSLTFPEVTADVELKSKKVQIQTAVVDGHEVDGTLTGSIFIRTPLDRSTLRLSGTVRPDPAFMKKLGESVPIEALIGKKINADGDIPFSISGVVSAPRYALK
jgi:type II secretion system protein N